MRSFLVALNRLMPLMFLVITGIAIFGFFSQHSVPWASAGRFVSRHRELWLWVGGVTAVLWLTVLIGVRHERRENRAPATDKDRSWKMDVLDRLTNREALEDRIRDKAEPTFIDAESLARELKGKVIGQDAVCDDVAAQIRRRLALRVRGKPIGIFLMAGPPGTGKTYLAKCLSSALQRTLVHLDMTQFARGGHAATQLFGSSKGYVGSDTYGKLTAALRDSPDSVVLLDEFEKAHPEVHKNFLTAWNDGFVTEASDGRQISTTRSIFVLTTNAAVSALTDLLEQHHSNTDELRKTSTRALLDWGFAPEVLNRIDRVFVFRPLKGLDIARVSALEIEAMIQNYGLAVASRGIDPSILHGLVQRQQNAGTFASSRDLVRSIEETIADSLIEAKRQGETTVSLTEKNGKIVAVAAAAIPAPARDYFEKLGD